MSGNFPELVKVSERIRDHLTGQRAACVDAHGDCVYRGEMGLSCAVGCLINSQHYHEGLEGLNADSQDVFAAVTASLRDEGIKFLPSQERYLLMLLERWQSYHDGQRKASVYPYVDWIDNTPDGFSPQVQHQHILHDLKIPED